MYNFIAVSEETPHRPLLFATDLWNMFNRKNNEPARANNSVEGWHRSCQAHVSFLPTSILEVFEYFV